MKSRLESGFTLLQMIIALAVVAALLTALVVPFVKRLDRVAGEKEMAALKSMGSAFKEGVRRERYVPDHTGWASMVAEQLGWELGEVTANERRIPHVFLIDPEIQIGANNPTALLPNAPLPAYDQPITGSTVVSNLTVIRPHRPRFMIISSTGKALPADLFNGLGETTGANAFTNIWETPEGAVPTGWSWNSTYGADLKIERVDISDLFVQVLLAKATNSATPFYGVDAELTSDGDSKLEVPNEIPNPMRLYFIKGSELKLYDSDEDLQYSEILFTSRDFTYELGTWQATSDLGRGVTNPMGKNMQRAMELFLRAPQNPYARFGTTRQDVYNAMVSYMEAFVAWRDAGNYAGEGCPGPVGNNTYTTALNNAATAVDNTTGNLIDP